MRRTSMCTLQVFSMLPKQAIACLQVTRHALDGVAAEQIVAVLDVAFQRALALCQVQGQVHVRGVHRHLLHRPVLRHSVQVYYACSHQETSYRHGVCICLSRMMH